MSSAWCFLTVAAALDRIDNLRPTFTQGAGEALQVFQVLIGRTQGAFERLHDDTRVGHNRRQFRQAFLELLLELFVADDVVHIIHRCCKTIYRGFGRRRQTIEPVNVFSA